MNITLYRPIFTFDCYENQISIHVFCYINFGDIWNKKLAIPLKGNKKSLYTTSSVCRYIKFSSRTLAISHNNQYKKSKGFLRLINFCTSTKRHQYIKLQNSMKISLCLVNHSTGLCYWYLFLFIFSCSYSLWCVLFIKMNRKKVISNICYAPLTCYWTFLQY